MINAQVKDIILNIGDTIRVHSNVIEGNKTRIQVFEGMVIALSGRGENKMMKIRRIGTGGVGVERMWPLNATSIVKVEVKKSAVNVRRSKLYFLRNLTGRRAVRI